MTGCPRFIWKMAINMEMVTDGVFTLALLVYGEHDVIVLLRSVIVLLSYLHDSVVAFGDVRSEILPRLEQVLLLDLPLSHQKAVEQVMWKSAFYQVIEVFRQELAEFDDEHVRQQLLAVIDSVISSAYSLHLSTVDRCLSTVLLISHPIDGRRLSWPGNTVSSCENSAWVYCNSTSCVHCTIVWNLHETYSSVG